MIIGIDEAKQDHNKLLSYGHQLAESVNYTLYEDAKTGDKRTMEEILEGLPHDSIVRSHTAIMLENTRKYFADMSETTKLINIGDFEKYAFPMVRAVFPNLASHNLASVQPMQGPVSLVFFMKFLYGLTKGSVVAGQDIIENPNADYAGEDIDGEVVGTGDGATDTYAATLSYTPLKPGTVKITAVGGAVSLEITDNGSGSLIGDVGVGVNTVNYASGAINATFSANIDLGEEVSVEYTYDMESNDTVPDIDMQLTSSPVTAKTRKLRTRWSLEAAQDLRNLHGLEAEIEQVAAISNELKFEIDREIINGILAIASNTVTAYSKTPAAGVSYTEHKLAFIDKVAEASNSIFHATQRATGTWIICGTNVATLIETLPGFVAMPRPKGTRAVYKCGTLNGQWDVWKDPNYGVNSYMVGYQGESMWEVGYIFAPYILAFTTPTVMLDDFQGRKGMASRYGKKAINGSFYCTSTITA